MINYVVSAVGTKRSLTQRGGTMKKYKNWLAICSVEDFYLRMALAMADLDTKEGMLLSERLPTYFSAQSMVGSFPLSYLTRLWEIELSKCDILHKELYQTKEFYEICEQVGIPVFKYSKFPTREGDAFMPFELEEFLLGGSDADSPKELFERRKDFVFQYQKKKFFIVSSEIETSATGGRDRMVLYFIPLECIAINK